MSNSASSLAIEFREILSHIKRAEEYANNLCAGELLSALQNIEGQVVDAMFDHADVIKA